MVLDLAGWTDALRTIPEQAWVKDVRSRFIAASERFVDACEVRATALVGHDESVCFPSPRVARFRAGDRTAIRRGTAVTLFELGPQGAHRTIKAPLYSAAGVLAGTVGIAIAADTDIHARIAELSSLFSPRSRQEAVPDWLRHVRTLLRRDFAKPVRLEPLADLVGRHPEHITRAFRLHFGVTPVKFVHRVRCARVAHACVTSDAPMTELALAVGFTDQSHLTRVFAHYFGLPPGRYRRALTVCDSEPGANHSRVAGCNGVHHRTPLHQTSFAGG